MTSSERFESLNNRLSLLILDITQAKAETDDLATRTWMVRTAERLEDARRTLHNAEITAKRAEGKP